MTQFVFALIRRKAFAVNGSFPARFNLFSVDLCFPQKITTYFCHLSNYYHPYKIVNSFNSFCKNLFHDLLIILMVTLVLSHFPIQLRPHFARSLIGFHRLETKPLNYLHIPKTDKIGLVCRYAC